MRILLLGKNGQVGWELQRTLAPLGDVVALGRQEADLGDFDRLREVVRSAKPEVIVNAAAYTDVDGAETNKDYAMRINGEAPGVLAEGANKLGAMLVHYSTDYVFNGEKKQPYTETDTANPLSTYGFSKLAGEKAIESSGAAYWILRSAWVYSLRGRGFVAKVIQWARENETLRIVDDQISNPTWARMLAEVTRAMMENAIGNLQERNGLYHLAGAGYASRFEWAKAVLQLDPHPEWHLVNELQPAATAEFPSLAKRPVFSALDCKKAETSFGLHIPHWEASLSQAMGESL